MAKYKVWLTVKDSYGNLKEVEGGTINVDLDAEALDKIEEAFPLNDFLKKSEIDYLATDAEVEAKKNLKYSSFFDEKSKGGAK
jgi:hypothetical protein